MKVTVERTNKLTDIQQPTQQQPDLLQKPTSPKKTPRRKTKASAAVLRSKKDSGAPSAKRSSRPETPLLKWKFDEVNDKNDEVEEEKLSGGIGRGSGRKVRVVVSARKLGADLWRLHSPEFQTDAGHRLGFQSEGGHVRAPVHAHHLKEVHSSPSRDLVHSPHNRLQFKHGPSVLFSNSAMEGATKWDPVGRKQSDELKKQVIGEPKLDQHVSPAVSALERELEQAKSRITELESEHKSSRKKLEQFLQKLSEEKAAWRRREHGKIHSVIDDMQVELKREKKNRQRLELVNSKLVNDLADAKLSAKRYAQEYEKERNGRELIEEVCDELAKEIGEDKEDIEALKAESMKFREEVEEEKKMLQMAEVWREERVQMKLVDAKVMLEEKYSQMILLIQELDYFISSKRKTSDAEDMKKAEFFSQVASSLSTRDIQELTYEPPNSGDIFSVFEEVNFRGSIERDFEIHSPEYKMIKNDHSNVHMDKSGEFEEDASEWETVSHHPEEDQVSSYSPNGTDPSINKNHRLMEWERSGGEEELPIVENSEVGPKQMRQLKKVSSISRLWKSSNGENTKLFRLMG